MRMRRRLLAQTLVSLTLMATAAPLLASRASADAGPHSGGPFAPTTDSCANCHRTHTGAGAGLIKASDSKTLCLTCHNGTGSQLNVVDGVQTMGGLGLRGGGFTNALMDTDANGLAEDVVSPTTSAHSTNTSSQLAWGGGAVSATPDYGTSVALTCVNCHNPHGNGQYRILRHQPTGGYNGGGAGSDVNVADEVAKTYTISYTAEYFRDTSYTPDNLSAWCGQCHSRYVAGPAAGHTESTDAVYKFRHDSTVGQGCPSCHVAHGSNAAMSALAGSSFPQPDGTTGADSRLLHIDNRGVCIQCHGNGAPNDITSN